MKKRIIAGILLAMCTFSACAQKDIYSEWEEDWAASEGISGDFKENAEGALSEEISSDAQGMQLPTKYSLDEEGVVTDVLMYGSSHDGRPVNWAYSAYNAIESNLLVQGKAKKGNVDLSEGHLVFWANRHPAMFDEETSDDCLRLMVSESASLSTCLVKGIEGEMIIARIANGAGPLSEEKVQFKDDDMASVESSAEKLIQDAADCRIGEYDADWFLLNANHCDINDRDTIKRTLMEKGAMQFGYGLNFNSFSEESAFYCKTSNGLMTQMALLVGWDDQYPKTNFKEGAQPEHDGAWLVYEPGGDALGVGREIWVSYEDATIKDMISYEMCERADYGEILFHDAIGYRDLIKTEDEYTTVANVFTMEEEGALKAVGIYTLDANQQVEIDVYGNPLDGTPDNGDWMTSLSLEVTNKGYHVFDLTETVPLQKGDRFSVVVRYLNSEETGSAAVEGKKGETLAAIGKVNYHMVSEIGESFAFTNGTWYDLSLEESAEYFGKEDAINNACIKAILENKS